MMQSYFIQLREHRIEYSSKKRIAEIEEISVHVIDLSRILVPYRYMIEVELSAQFIAPRD